MACPLVLVWCLDIGSFWRNSGLPVAPRGPERGGCLLTMLLVADLSWMRSERCPSLVLARLSIRIMNDEDYCGFLYCWSCLSVSFPQSNLWLHLHYVTLWEWSWNLEHKPGGGWRPTHHDAVNPSQEAAGLYSPAFQKTLQWCWGAWWCLQHQRLAGPLTARRRCSLIHINWAE